MRIVSTECLIAGPAVLAQPKRIPKGFVGIRLAIYIPLRVTSGNTLARTEGRRCQPSRNLHDLSTEASSTTSGAGSARGGITKEETPERDGNEDSPISRIICWEGA